MINRRSFLGLLGTGAATAAFGGCACGPKRRAKNAKIALQLYSVRTYIGGAKNKEGVETFKGVGLERALDNIAAIGYKGVEFAGYYNFQPKELKTMLANAGLKACGTHVGPGDYGLDLKAMTFNPEVLKKTCEFNLGYGNNNILNPGGAAPQGITWHIGQDGTRETLDAAQADYTKKLCDLFNEVAEEAAKCGCRIGLHNHMWEHGYLMPDGTSFWDYFFSNTSEAVCIEQDVGWSTCAGVKPWETYEKYPHRSPTLHAKENGMGKNVTKFDAILGKPGVNADGSTVVGVDWDKLIPITEKDGVEWYVVECEKHEQDLSAVLPSYNFLRQKGLN